MNSESLLVHPNIEAYFQNMAEVYFQLWGPSSTWGLFTTRTISLRDAALQTTRHIGTKIPEYDNSRILDLGCGAGGSTLVLTEVPDSKIIGLDICQSQLDIARRVLGDQTGDNVKLTRANAESIPFQDRYFSVVVCTGAFFYFENKNNVVKEVSRVLREGGTFIVDDMLCTGKLSDVDRALIRMRHNVESLPSLDEYRAWFDKYGFRITEEEDLTTHFVRTYQMVLDALPQHIDLITNLSGPAQYDEAMAWFTSAARLGETGGLGRYLIVARKT